MAGVSMKDIKLRIRSMESTKQITKAMEMVAASKLRKAQERVLRARPYFETLYETLCTIAEKTEDFDSPYLAERSGSKVCYVVIAGDRGLAGGYNSNVLKMAYAEMQGRDACVLPIGKRSVEFFQRRGVKILTEAYAEAADISISECFSASKLLCRLFLDGAFDEIFIIYTTFVSILSQTPTMRKILPLPKTGKEQAGDPTCLTLYEPSSFEVFDAIIPEYLGGVLYGALCESVASEQGARRTAMDAATKNAEEMIEGLSLQYNRARQGAITQEITEIVAGGES